MANHRGIDGFPTEYLDELPADVRNQFRRWGRASAAVRLYRRRGWNPSAVLHQRDRERLELQRLLDLHEHRENNPTLF